MSSNNWLKWLRAKRVSAPSSVNEAHAISWADRQRNEALNLIEDAEKHGTWLELSNSHNGFAREVAVRQLSTRASPQALAALIERMNDWVFQIRELAADAVQPYLTSAHAGSLVLALDRLIALSAQQRANHQATLAKARAALQSTEVRNEVHAAFLARHGKAARYLLALLLEVDETPERLLRNALAHHELNVRLDAIAACQALPPAEALPLLQEALSRAAAKVKVRILRAMLPLLADPGPLLQHALLDASPSVRNLAQWEAARCGIDSRAVLAVRLAGQMPQEKREWLGVLGLASALEQKIPEAWLLTAWQSRFPLVRLAVLCMPGEQPATWLLEGLADPADKVFHASILCLQVLPWTQLEALLIARLDTHWHELPDERTQATFRLLPRWQQAAYLLKRMDAAPVQQTSWLRQIAQWCEQQYLMVDPVTAKAQQVAVRSQLERLVEHGLLERSSVARVVG